MTKKKAPKLRIINSHEYMSLVMPNGRFTMGYNGEKLSGECINEPGLFDRLINFVNDQSNGANFGERFEKLANPEVLSKLYPNWDKITEPTVAVGHYAKFSDPKLMKKYGIVKVDLLKGRNAIVTSINTKIRVKCPVSMLEPA